MPRPRTHARRSGFTLIELLVVVAIIALLIAILLPSLARAKKQTVALRCAANLRSNGQAMLTYVLENKFYPGHHVRETVASDAAVKPFRRGEMTFPKVLSGKYPAPGVWWCPAADPKTKWNPDLPLYGPVPGVKTCDLDFTYGYNDWGTSGSADSNHQGLGGYTDRAGYGDGPARESQVVNPTEMIAMADTNPNGVWDFALEPVDSTQQPYDRHLGKANVLWADGHVVPVASKTIVEPFKLTGQAYREAWLKISRLWRRDNKPPAGI